MKNTVAREKIKRNNATLRKKLQKDIKEKLNICEKHTYLTKKRKMIWRIILKSHIYPIDFK
jgi:hypothetical protein